VSQQHRAGLLTRWQQERWLRQVDRVGEGWCLSGRPDLVNEGQFVIGQRFFLASSPTQSHIVAMRGALLEVGNDVSIGYGAAITAQSAIRIGNNTRIGPFAVIMDGDFHRPGDRDASGDVAPITIGADVVIGARVTILRGTDIGRGVHVRSGSMVSGTVPPGTVVGGVPARALLDVANTDLPDVAELIQRVLGLALRPAPTLGPREIPEWDSLGTLRLLLAIEETYGVTIREEEVHSARTVAALTDLVETAKAR
jgi:maltose O-acetyltransferase